MKKKRRISKYYSYMGSASWRSKRMEKLAIHSRCQICDSIEELNIHHRWYSLNGKSIVGKEDIDRDLITFCKECHEKWHQIYGLKMTTKRRLEEFLSVRTGIQATFIEKEKKKKKIPKTIKRASGKSWPARNKKFPLIKQVIVPLPIDTRETIKSLLDV